MKIYKLFFVNEYKIEDYRDEKEHFEKSLKIFVEKNKYKYKIIYKNKIYPSQNSPKIEENKIGKLKIKLICYNRIKNILDIFFDLSMFNRFQIIKFKKNMNIYKYIDYLLYSSHTIRKLKYKINNKDKINIFGKEFVENNENKCLIIYKDKIIHLQTYFLIEDINKEDKENKKFEILLLELEDITDRSYMFLNCELLVEFSNYEINNNEIKSNIIEEENYLNSEKTEKFNNYYSTNIDEDTINKNDSNLSK